MSFNIGWRPMESTFQGPIISADESPQELRFVVRDGERVLQQRWTIVEYTVNGVPVRDRHEWRDVPTVDESTD